MKFNKINVTEEFLSNVLYAVMNIADCVKRNAEKVFEGAERPTKTKAKRRKKKSI